MGDWGFIILREFSSVTFFVGKFRICYPDLGVTHSPGSPTAESDKKESSFSLTVGVGESQGVRMNNSARNNQKLKRRLKS